MNSSTDAGPLNAELNLARRYFTLRPIKAVQRWTCDGNLVSMLGALGVAMRSSLGPKVGMSSRRALQFEWWNNHDGA